MNSHCHVAPRYTPGSPALVSLEVAERTAREEREFIEHALGGVWGEERRAEAERLGLRGIAEVRVERRDHWEVRDLCTGARFRRLFPEKLRKLKFRTYADLRDWERRLVDGDPPQDMPDYRRKGWFRVEVAPFRSFPTGHRITVYRPEDIPC